MKRSCAELSCSIGIHHLGKMNCHWHRSSMATYSSFGPEWQRSDQEARQQKKEMSEKSQRYYNARAHALPEIQIGTNVAVQDHRTKLWDTYGVVTEIGPQRQYHIKTQRGSVLVRNRHFIRHRIPESVPYWRYDNQWAKESKSLGEKATPQPRRSSWEKKAARRLIEDPDWN